MINKLQVMRHSKDQLQMHKEKKQNGNKQKNICLKQNMVWDTLMIDNLVLEEKLINFIGIERWQWKILRQQISEHWQSKGSNQ